MAHPQTLRIALADGSSVGGLVLAPPDAVACYVLAHGAGAGMEHPFMTEIALRLAERKIATLRYQFPYMEEGSKRPDRPPVAHAAVRAAVLAAADQLRGLPLFAGGKSFGGRMTSQAQASQPLPGVGGLIFLGFPLHEAAKPSTDRAKHLSDVSIPMLFIQGTKDKLAEIDLIRGVLHKLGSKAQILEVPEADHSFHVPKRSGRTDGEVLAEIAEAISAWIGKLV